MGLRESGSGRAKIWENYDMEDTAMSIERLRKQVVAFEKRNKKLREQMAHLLDRVELYEATLARAHQPRASQGSMGSWPMRHGGEKE